MQTNNYNIEEEFNKISSENKPKLISEINAVLQSDNEEELNRLIGLLDTGNNAAAELLSNALSESSNCLLNSILLKIVTGNYNVKMRSASFDILKNKAKKNGDFLINYCANADLQYRRFVSELLRFGNFTSHGAPSACLRKFCADEDEIVRANAAESIGFLKLKLVQTLKKTLLNDSFLVKASAIFSLGELKMKSTLADLKYEFWKNKDDVVKKLIIDAIAKIDGREGFNFLTDIASSKNNYKRIDKIYLIKNIYRIYTENYKNTKYKNAVIKKIQNIDIKINILKLEFYEDKLIREAILFYFSLSNVKKSIKIFNFLMIYLNKNSITPDNAEYKYIKDSIVKVAKPFYIKKYLEYMSASFEIKMANSGTFFNSYPILIEILSENRYFNEIAVLLNYFKDRKTFVELNIALLAASASIINYSDPKLSKSVLKNALFLLNDGNGDIRKAASDLIGKSKNIDFIKYIYNKAINEQYPDVLDNYIKNIIILTNNNKIYFKFFINNLHSNNTRIREISLRIIKEFKISPAKHLNKKDLIDIYNIFKILADSKSESENVKALLASVISNFSNLNLTEYKYLKEDFLKILYGLLKDNDNEEILYNSLDSLVKLGVEDSNIFFETLQPHSKHHSVMFRFKVIELIGKLHDSDAIDSDSIDSDAINSDAINYDSVDSADYIDFGSKAHDYHDSEYYIDTENKNIYNKNTRNIGGVHNNFNKLLGILRSSDEILIKISILRSLYSINETKARAIIKNYLNDTNEDLRNIAEELLKIRK